MGGFAVVSSADTVTSEPSLEGDSTVLSRPPLEGVREEDAANNMDMGFEGGDDGDRGFDGGLALAAESPTTLDTPPVDME